MTGYNEMKNDRINTIENYLLSHPDVRGFYNYLRISKSLNTVYRYIAIADRLLHDLHKKPNELGFDDFTYFMSSTAYDENGEAKTSSFMIQQYHALKLYNEYLVKVNILPVNYMDSIARPKPIESQKTIEKRAKSFLTKEELKVYLEAVREGVGTENAKRCQMRMKERDYAIILVFLTTGIRRSAMQSLDVDNVDLKNHTLWVTDKGGKVKDYQLNKGTEDAIVAWLKRRDEVLNGKQTTALFLNQYGDRLKDDGLCAIVTKYACDINGKHITPHKLRATYGTQLYEATKDIYFVQKAMGHNSPTTTERYIRGQADVTKQASDIMGSLL